MLRAPGALSLLILTPEQRQIPKQTPESEPACATVIVNLTKSNQRQIFLWKQGALLFDGHFVFEERNAPVYLYYVSAFRMWAIGSSIGGTTNVHHTTQRRCSAQSGQVLTPFRRLGLRMMAFGHFAGLVAAKASALTLHQRHCPALMQHLLCTSCFILRLSV
jgi:hypothetical protein